MLGARELEPAASVPQDVVGGPAPRVHPRLRRRRSRRPTRRPPTASPTSSSGRADRPAPDLSSRSPASTSARASAATSSSNTEARRDRLPGRRHRRRRASYNGKGGVKHRARSSAAPRSPCASATSTRSSRQLHHERLEDPLRPRRRATRVAGARAVPRSFDADPYPVVVDGRIEWVIDAYTTTDRYPYAAARRHRPSCRRAAASTARFNYVRNSVKAVVDAYDGTVKFYVVDHERPDHAGLPEGVPEAVHHGSRDARRAAGALALPGGPVPGADQHVGPLPHRRRLASSTASSDAWNIAQDPGTVAGVVEPDADHPTRRAATPRVGEQRIDPYYLLMQLPGKKQVS